MKAVLMNGYGGAEVLYAGDAPDPVVKDHDILVRVRATALNRADLLQRRGLYPPPPGESEILGLEAAGEVVHASGDGGWQVGDRVCALLPGGGYAEYAALPATMAMRIPEGWSYEQAAAMPEAYLTAYMNLVWLGGLAPGSPGKRVLVHAGASGVGTAAIQLARELGAEVYATAGSPQKLRMCAELGAKGGWNYRDGAFSEWIMKETGGAGVDIVLDFIGVPYFADNLKVLALDGRLVVIGTIGGGKVDGFRLGDLMAKRLHVTGATLRGRTVADKVRLTREFFAFAEPLFASGRLAPVIDSVYDWRNVAEAHGRMESNENIGKIVLRIG